jgi:hypothetical protein
MIARSLSRAIVFNRPFLLKGIDRMLPAGAYRVITDEELIEGIFLSSLPPSCDHDLRAGTHTWSIID